MTVIRVQRFCELALRSTAEDLLDEGSFPRQVILQVAFNSCENRRLDVPRIQALVLHEVCISVPNFRSNKSFIFTFLPEGNVIHLKYGKTFLDELQWVY